VVEQGESFLVDQFLSPGFSGGPLIYMNAGSNSFQIGGVVVGYPYEKRRFYGIDAVQEMPFGFSIISNAEYIERAFTSAA